MPALTIKGIPEELLERLRRSAEANRRSLNAEVIHRLERAVADQMADPDPYLARVRETRERMNLWVTDEEIRAVRDAGRAAGDIDVTPEMEEFVGKKLATGLYGSASELVRDGLRLLMERDRMLESRLRDLTEQVTEGLEQARAGELIPAEDVFADIRSRSDERRSRGR